MADQLLWLETLLKGGIGLLMILLPLTMAKIAGLPHTGTAFWPRLFGASLIGIAAAFAVNGYAHLNPQLAQSGLGLGGAIAINLITVLSLAGTLIFKGVSTTRGVLLIWLFGLLLTGLILVEIANL